MPRDYTAMTKAQLVALLVARDAEPTRGTSEASAHYTARDIPCDAAKACDKTFKTTKGRDWHTANVAHPVKAK